MPYDLQYRALFKNFEGMDCTLRISDTTSGTSGPVELSDIKLMSLERRVVTDGEEKVGIKGVRLLFSFLSTEAVNLFTFATGADDTYLVEVFIESTSNPAIFTGYLVLDATKTLYQPDGTFGVELTASDNLGILKELPLSKFDGSTPKGLFKWIEFIAWCLAKTGLQLPIKAAYNLFEESYNGASNDPLSTLYLEAMTFETEVNGRQNCYEVLEKFIKGMGCFLTQENAAWWIVRVDEMNAAAYRVYTYSYLGAFISASTPTLGKQIGKEQLIKLINRDAEIMPERKNKFVLQKFSLTPFSELPCNVDFVRGTSVPISLPSGYQGYTIECWTPGRLGGGAQLASPYIRRQFVDGYETERVVVIPQSAIGLGFSQTQHYIESEPIPVNIGDKFNFSVDGRLSQDVSDGSGTYRDNIVQIRLYGADGSRWHLTNQILVPETPGDWVLSSSSFASNRRYIQHVWNGEYEDETKWYTVSVEAKPIPRTGYITIVLMQSPKYGASVDTHYSNIQLEYIPLLAGTYGKLTAQHHKVSTTQTLKANVEEEVFISDSPNNNFKGTIYKNGTGTRSGRFYNYLAGTGGELGLEKFGKYQAYALWNQHNRVIRKFSASLLGLNTDTFNDLPGLLHRYQFTADSDHTNDKYWALLSYSQNLISCQWSGTFSDVLDTTIGKSYADIHEFKYTTQ